MLSTSRTRPLSVVKLIEEKNKTNDMPFEYAYALYRNKENARALEVLTAIPEERMGPGEYNLKAQTVNAHISPLALLMCNAMINRLHAAFIAFFFFASFFSSSIGWANLQSAKGYTKCI